MWFNFNVRKLRDKIGENMSSKLDIQLRYADSDQMGVIYHANYFTFFEQGRTKYLKDLGFDYQIGRASCRERVCLYV